MKFKVVSRASFILVLTFSVAIPGRPAPDMFEANLSFADDLMIQKRYSAAELEYERLASVYPDHPRREEAISRMLNAAHQAGDPAFALSLARSWKDRLKNS